MIDNETYNIFMSNGLKRVWEEDSESQDIYLGNLMKNIRNSEEDLLLGTNSIFVPNNDYLIQYFGSEITNEEFDIYKANGENKYLHCILIPIYDVLGNIVATTAYNPQQTLINRGIKELEMKPNKSLEEQEDLVKLREKKELKYILPSAKRVKVSNHMYFPKGVYKKCIEDGYVVVVDGMFDAISLNHYGINSMALMGSKVTDVKLFMLSNINQVFIANDNDLAGLEVLKKLESYLPNTVRIKNRKTSDIDEYISKYGIGNIKEEIESCLNNKYKKFILLK